MRGKVALSKRKLLTSLTGKQQHGSAFSLPAPQYFSHVCIHCISYISPALHSIMSCLWNFFSSLLLQLRGLNLRELCDCRANRQRLTWRSIQTGHNKDWTSPWRGGRTTLWPRRRSQVLSPTQTRSTAAPSGRRASSATWYGGTTPQRCCSYVASSQNGWECQPRIDKKINERLNTFYFMIFRFGKRL